MDLQIGVLISGGGSNLQAIIDKIKTGYIPNSKIAVVISNKKDAFGLERAKNAGIESVCIDPDTCGGSFEYNTKIADELHRKKVNIVCLAGYLLMIKGKLLQAFKGRILNIHPALLPKYGGKGMYGHFVHEAVLKAGEKVSGATVHLVDDKYDHGQILMQRTIDVLPGDTPETLAKRLLEIEHQVYPETLKLIAEGKIILGGHL